MKTSQPGSARGIEASAPLDPEAWMVELAQLVEIATLAEACATHASRDDPDGTDPLTEQRAQRASKAVTAVLSHARTLMEAYKRDAVDAERYRWMRHRDNTVAAGIVSVKWDEDMDAAIDAARAPKDTPSTKEQ